MVCSSATQNLPKHETNFFVPPPHCSKPSLHEQPPFLLAMLSNNWKKQPRLFGGQKVSICFVICIFVCKKLYWIHQPHLQPLFHTGEWSKPTHNPPNLSCLIPGVGGRGLSKCPSWSIGLNVGLTSSHHHPLAPLQPSRPKPLPANRIHFDWGMSYKERWVLWASKCIILWLNVQYPKLTS